LFSVRNDSLHQLYINTTTHEIHRKENNAFGTTRHAPKEMNFQSICKTRVLLKTGIHFSSHLSIIRIKYLESAHDSNSRELKRITWS